MNAKISLIKKITPYNPENVKTVEEALVALQNCSFQGRNLGKALEVLSNMAFDSSCYRVLTLSGAMIPAGMEEIINKLIERGVISAIVTTGANIIHSIVNSAEPYDNQAHYIPSDKIDDKKLLEQRLNRIYDTLLPESGYQRADDLILSILRERFKNKKKIIISPSQLFEIIGNALLTRSFLKIAAIYQVPVFCGATSDSELALNLARYRKRHGLTIILDEIADMEQYGNIMKEHISIPGNSAGTIIIGGGVPRNWAQQIFPYLYDIMDVDPNTNENINGFKYSVRFHTAVPHDGGLSGCTVSESISWGKYSANSTHQSVWGDATVYFPLIATALLQRMGKENISSMPDLLPTLKTIQRE